MHGQIAVMIEFGVGPLFESVAEDDHAATGFQLQVEFNMAVTEDIIIAVVMLFLLIFGEEHQLLFALAFVRTGVCQLFETAFLRPTVTDLVTPCRR